MLQPARADCSAEHSYDRVIPDMSRRLTACDRSCSCLLPIGASIDPAAGGETEQSHPQTCHDEEHLAFHSITSVFSQITDCSRSKLGREPILYRFSYNSRKTAVHGAFSFQRSSMCLTCGVLPDLFVTVLHLILVFNKTVKNRFIRLLFQQPAAQPQKT